MNETFDLTVLEQIDEEIAGIEQAGEVLNETLGRLLEQRRLIEQELTD